MSEGENTLPGAPVSIVILSLNEEINIEECLASCAWCDDVHVLDSGSSDRTQELARQLGAEVHEHPFESFGAQRNWAIENITTRYEWIFHLDADERFTPELVEEIGSVLSVRPTEAGYHVPSKLMFMGRWLRYSGGYPAYQMRLFHKGRMRFRDYGHGQREMTDGVVGKLLAPYLHYNFSKGIDDWYDKHNVYSRQEARIAFEETCAFGVGIKALFSGDRVARRRALKSLGYRLPLRASMVKLYMLIVQRGFLDGRAGWNYVNMRTIYERMIDTKLTEIRSNGSAA